MNPLFLASSLPELLKHFQEEGIQIAAQTPLCLTADPSTLIGLNSRYGVGYFGNPMRECDLLHQGWSLRGFDVVDLNGLISGLKGCGYREPTWSELRQAFGQDINRDGLFNDAESAFLFAQARGLEIRAHAPFVVVGLLTQTAH
jgi:hypothetical protein